MFSLISFPFSFCRTRAHWGPSTAHTQHTRRHVFREKESVCVVCFHSITTTADRMHVQRAHTNRNTNIGRCSGICQTRAKGEGDNWRIQCECNACTAVFPRQNPYECVSECVCHSDCCCCLPVRMGLCVSMYRYWPVFHRAAHTSVRPTTEHHSRPRTRQRIQNYNNNNNTKKKPLCVYGEKPIRLSIGVRRRAVFFLGCDDWTWLLSI